MELLRRRLQRWCPPVHQQWNVHVWNDGTRQLRTMATNKCLYDDGVTLTTRACNSSPQHGWWAYESGDKVTFRSRATNECLDDRQYGLRTNTCYYDRHQTWR
ncbi:RICIN domain-containing protein [Streptomyces sp. NPDC088745]|uniref:RICIN domain-containing protein n=1 Tax=Streptomyces sp. NPDC088745 TaxID=3365884 RepID=UPI0037FEDA79